MHAKVCGLLNNRGLEWLSTTFRLLGEGRSADRVLISKLLQRVGFSYLGSSTLIKPSRPRVTDLSASV